MTYLLLIYEFIKTGLFTIGGGMATLPFLYAMADRYPWFTRELLVDMIAISESTPGPIGINAATYAGHTAGGIAGGIVASLAVAVPSLVIVFFVARALDRFKNNRFVQNAFYGLRPAVAALITSAGLGVATVTIADTALFPDFLRIWDYKRMALFAVLMLAVRLIKKIQPVWLIAAAAVAGVVFTL